MTEPRRITFPHMGNYWVAIKRIAAQSGAEVVVPPQITRRTIELGARYSPEFVCVPFKYTLGSLIEGIEQGANVACQLCGGCRFSYYAEVQEAILHDLGHKVDFVGLQGGANMLEVMLDFRRKVAPNRSLPSIASTFLDAFRMGEAIDEVGGRVRRDLAFEAEPGALRKVEAQFLRDLDATTNNRQVTEVRRAAVEALDHVQLNRPERPLRVLIVGELYVVMEPYTNCRIEDELSANGVEVHRPLDVTTLIRHSIGHHVHIRKMIAGAAPYVTRHLGAEGTESVARTLSAIRDGYDGVVHLKPFGCMPEVNAMAALQRISREHTFPILFVSCDAQSAEAGLRTRVEAFADMLKIREAGVMYA
jgi:predicted nucleotide-binding protein (sugar kinase/HSP70/actin superfamily)